VLLYIRVEDVLGDTAPQPRRRRSLDALPPTLCLFYDTAMRHHARAAALRLPEEREREALPDWKLDRLVIRIALYGREKLGLEPGTRALVFGKLGWLWPVVELAVQGFGAAAVGVEHDVDDAALLDALRRAEPRFVVATDRDSARRVVELRRSGLLSKVAIVADEPGGTAGEALPLGQLLELGGTLDTPERAQAFRLLCRRVEPEAEALWHVGGRGTLRLSHALAMERLRARIEARAPAGGDVLYVQQPRATLAARLAIAAAIGDGLTEAVFGGEAATSAQLAALRPHGLLASAAWLESLCQGQGPRWPAALDARRARRRLQERLGDRLRWAETERPTDAATAAALAAAGIDGVAEDEA
jgi:hypothetical protein